MHGLLACLTAKNTIAPGVASNRSLATGFVEAKPNGLALGHDPRSRCRHKTSQNSADEYRYSSAHFPAAVSLLCAQASRWRSGPAAPYRPVRASECLRCTLSSVNKLRLQSIGSEQLQFLRTTGQVADGFEADCCHWLFVAVKVSTTTTRERQHRLRRRRSRLGCKPTTGDGTKAVTLRPTCPRETAPAPSLQG